METFKEYVLGGSVGMQRPVADLNASTELGQRKITQSDIDQIEKYADRLFASLDIDVEFTRHFMDRVNDARNIKQITVAELIRLFKQAYRRYGKKIAKLPDQANAVINDMKTNINLPFVLKYKKDEIELVAKTVMRKKNFTTSASSPKLSFESFQDKIDEGIIDTIKQGLESIRSSNDRKRKERLAGQRGRVHRPKKVKKEEIELDEAKRDAGYPDDSVKIGKKHYIIYKDRRDWYGFEVDKEGNQVADAIFDPRKGELKKILLRFQEEVELDEIATGDFAPVTHQMSLAELIFDSAGYGSDMSATSTVRGGPGSVANNMWMPLSSSIFNRALPKQVRATVFHVTRMSNFDQLYAIQNSRRSISTFANMDRGPIAGGVQGGSGLVVEVEGNVLVAAKEDIFSIPEKSGRRMMAFNWFRGPWGERDVLRIQRGLEKLLKSLVNKHGKSFDGKAPMGKGDWEKWEYMRVAYVKQKAWGDRSAGRVMQRIVKDYLDGVERVFKQNARQIQAILTRYVENLKTDENWDEIVVDDFNIKKVWIITDSDELNPGEADEFKSNISLTKLPVETIDSADMEAHVKYIAQLSHDETPTYTATTQRKTTQKKKPSEDETEMDELDLRRAEALRGWGKSEDEIKATLAAMR